MKTSESSDRLADKRTQGLRCIPDLAFLALVARPETIGPRHSLEAAADAPDKHVEPAVRPAVADHRNELKVTSDLSWNERFAELIAFRALEFLVAKLGDRTDLNPVTPHTLKPVLSYAATGWN
ncbi:hypothetical protein [Rhodopirellula baltica]